MRDGWRQVRLGDVISLAYGKALREQDRNPGIVPVVGSNGRFGWHDTANVHGKTTIVIGRKGTAGSVNWYPEPVWVTDTAFAVSLISEALTPEFAYLALQGSNLPGFTAQTGVPGLNRDRVYALNLWLPPLEEQHRIVSIMAAVDDAIVEAETARTSAEHLRQEALKAYFASGNEDVLGAALTPASHAEIVRDEQTYRIVGLERSGAGFIDRGCIKGSETGYKRMTRLGINQLVYRKLTAWEGPISVTADTEVNSYVSGEFPVFEIDSRRILPGLLRHACTSSILWERMAKGLQGSVLRRKRLNPEQLKGITIPFPAMDEQQEILGILDACEDSASSAGRDSAALSTLRTELLIALLSGEHQIPSSYDKTLEVAFEGAPE